MALTYLTSSFSSIIEQVNRKGYSRVFLIENKPFLVLIEQDSLNDQTLMLEIRGHNKIDENTTLSLVNKNPHDYYEMSLICDDLSELTQNYKGIRPVIGWAL